MSRILNNKNTKNTFMSVVCCRNNTE